MATSQDERQPRRDLGRWLAPSPPLAVDGEHAPRSPVDHEITIVEARPGTRHGHPMIGACCACGWRSSLKAGPRGTEFAVAEGEEHLAEHVSVRSAPRE